MIYSTRYHDFVFQLLFINVPVPWAVGIGDPALTVAVFDQHSFQLDVGGMRILECFGKKS